MDAVGLLQTIRARAAARGMTLAALARAVEMQPSNLRRMLTHPSATSRLGTVMRLLPPLGCRIVPPGASTADALVAFLDEQGHRLGQSWESLVGEAGAPARMAPERLPLEAVMRVAAALNIELTLVDDAHPVSTEESPNRRRASSSPAEDASSPARRVASSPRSTASSGSTRLARKTSSRAARHPDAVAPLPPLASSPTSPPGRTAPAPRSAASSSTAPSRAPHELGPLRPPRLGRYRDAPPEPPRARPPLPPWTPPEHKSAIDGAVVEQLAEFSGDDWRDIFTLASSMWSGAAALPARTLEALGHWTANRLARLRRHRSSSPVPPDLPEPPEGWFGEHDLRLLMRHWNAAREPGYKPSGVIVQRNEHGLLVGHLSLDDDTMAVIRPAPRGRPPSLANLVQPLPGGELRSWLTQEVPLEIKVGDERHLFRHVRAGPIFGELVLGDQTFLLAAMSVFLVLVKVRGEDASVVWVGRGEMLPTLTLDAPRSGTLAETPLPGAEVPAVPADEPTPAGCQAAADVDARAVIRELEDERQRRRAAEEVGSEASQKLEAAVRDLGEERQRRAAAERVHAQAVQELEARTVELADERQRRQTLEHEQAAALLALGLAKQAAEILPAELAAQVDARVRSETEARLAMLMLRKTMEVLTLHATDNVVADWKRQIVAVLVEAGAGLGPDINATTQFAEQFIGAFRSADTPPADEAGGPEATPTPSEAPVPGETMLPDRHAASGDPGSDAVTTTRVDAEPSDMSQPAAAGSSDERASPLSARRIRQWSKWPSPEPVDVVSKSPPAEPKVGRNDPCPCRSGKKFKKCCWRA